MFARALLVLLLGVFLAGLTLLAWVATSPRQPSQLAAMPATQTAGEHDDTQDERPAVELMDLADVIAELPTATVRPKLDRTHDAVPDPEGPGAQLPSATSDTPSHEAPRLLTAPPAKPLGQARGETATNRPGSLAAQTSMLTSSSLERADVMTVMRALHDPQLATAARHRLAALGFAENHIELARRFTSTDTDQRVNAVRSLPSVRGIVPADWFLWASRDSDPVVRRAAVALMTTSGQPELMSRVAELVETDSDPDLRELARRSLQQTRRRGR